MRYKVIDPNGVLLGGKRIHEGGFIPSSDATSSQIKAWKRFKQVEAVKEEPEGGSEPDPAAQKPKGGKGKGKVKEEPEGGSEPDPAAPPED